MPAVAAGAGAGAPPAEVSHDVPASLLGLAAHPEAEQRIGPVTLPPSLSLRLHPGGPMPPLIRSWLYGIALDLSRAYASDDAFRLAVLAAVGLFGILLSFRLGLGSSYAIRISR
jgi:hypothetical protein